MQSVTPSSPLCGMNVFNKVECGFVKVREVYLCRSTLKQA